MKPFPLKTSLIALLFICSAKTAFAFCGFYVAKADAKIFNKASQVVLVRDEDKTVLTMANDFRGDPKEFAVVIPVPTFLERDQIHVGEKALIDHLDAYTSPRLVEYFDEDPCEAKELSLRARYGLSRGMTAAAPGQRPDSLGVKIEAQYTVGEYDIVILSAEQSNGLETWLKQNGYRIPNGAARVLESYIKQKMRFFVAKVNLKEQAKLGVQYLRPLQVAYESPKFMLPIRLGTVNADGPQELFIYTLTRKGRVETTNYRTVKLPSDLDIPVYVKNEFADFYRAMFAQAVKKEDMRVLFLEYAWDMGWCDPCAADPLSNEELQKLGVFWLGDSNSGNASRRRPQIAPGGAANVFVTRLHVRYDREHFPEDLVFQETADRNNFQGRYVMRHPWQGQANCDGAKQYLEVLKKRQNSEAETLARLTGWDINDIRGKMKISPVSSSKNDLKWYQKIWK